MTSARTPSERDFAVTPPPAYAAAFLASVGLVLPLVAIGVAVWLTPEARTGMSRAWPALAVLPVVLALLFAAMRRRAVRLADGMLEVRAAMFRERTPVSQFDLASARVVDLAERTELRPLLKTGGMSLPGFHAGRFRLRAKLARAFCLLTDTRRVLWLPLRDGNRHVLLSLEQPQSLLDALRGH